ncbi:MAG TPA: XdhC family protein [Ktedonobacteraceae bacterium]|nr:XdhC family protein [Ktedonobacteraceae bacterium]
MTDTLLELAYHLTQTSEPFVLATVVWCERPTSAKPGARAIIQADGTMTGWIGGSCAQPVVMREAQRMLREGDDPYLLRLGTSEMAMERDNMRVFPMSCASGGVLDIYMEPHVPLPQLVLIGDSPVIGVLKNLADLVDFHVTQLTSADLSHLQIDERTSIIVATHGYYDEDALEQALRSPAAYVGMVGSHKRAATCRDYLRASGLSEQQIERLRAPVGLDIGAVTPAEIAASILAELVQTRHQDQQRAMPQAVPQQEQAQDAQTEQDSNTAVDPVCGMMVEIATARHHFIMDGQDFYFCCPACKRLFERNPQEYLVKNER